MKRNRHVQSEHTPIPTIGEPEPELRSGARVAKSRKNRERTTLAGTPTIVAPAAIYLVGEWGLPEEEVAILAAITCYATAQYFPNVIPLSPLLAKAVERAKIHLDEAAAALPRGSVLLEPARAGEGGEHLDRTPAIAVATTAAVFETAGQSISERKDEILMVAEAAYLAIHGETGVDGRLAAALHGGLIKIANRPITGSCVEAFAGPAGLHLVIFRTGEALFPPGWLSVVRQLSEPDRCAHAPIIEGMLEQAGRTAAALACGDATAAIVSIGRYGHCMMQLAAAMSAPLQSKPFLQAMRLAEEIGGVVIPSSAGQGDLGIALFATPEAASLFPRACRPPLIPLGFDLDRLGVRILPASNSGESANQHTPAPGVVDDAIVKSRVEDITTQKTLSEPDWDSAPTVVTPMEALALGATEILASQDERPRRARSGRTGVRLVLVGALVAAAVAAVWLTRPFGHAPLITSPVHPVLHRTSLPEPNIPESTIPSQPLVLPAGIPETATPTQPVVLPTGHKPPAAKSHAPSARARVAASGNARGKRLASVPSDQITAKPAAPAAHKEPSKPSPRAGTLSPADF